ncbi:MAG: PA0069 family radical SAM protein [Polyangia bacterium]
MLRPVTNPPNPWRSTEIEYLDEVPPARLELYEDHSRQILSHNDSPDLGFRYSLNPYRGCIHGCAYCYARPTHEYLSFGAGTDFERKIVYKPEAPALLREAFERASWQGELIVLSGVTDCYQPVEASLGLTRGCLAVCAEYKNPVAIITKAPLVERDLDLLTELHQRTQLSITVSIPLWDPERARAVEPYVASPQRRVRTIEKLARAGLRVGVNVAPLIPGLAEEDLAKVLSAAAAAGARYAGSVFLRLPGSVRAVFEERIRASLPLRAERILSRVREARGGKLYDPKFGTRHRGEGPYAESLHALFRSACEKVGLRAGFGDADEGGGEPPRPTFQRPPRAGEQLSLL